MKAKTFGNISQTIRQCGNECGNLIAALPFPH